MPFVNGETKIFEPAHLDHLSDFEEINTPPSHFFRTMRCPNFCSCSFAVGVIRFLMLFNVCKNSYWIFALSGIAHSHDSVTTF